MILRIIGAIVGCGKVREEPALGTSLDSTERLSGDLAGMACAREQFVDFVAAAIARTLQSSALHSRVARVYITDATHFLDGKGAIGPQSGPGRELAEFFGGVIVAATLPNHDAKLPICRTCGGAIEVAINSTDSIEWHCSGCAKAGRISNWRLTLWDMSASDTTGRSC